MSTLSKRTVIWRGFRLRCPKCGEGALFRAYLKPVDACASCGHDWSKVRADDGPAWATMLVVLHLMAPLFHVIGFKADLPMWASSLILSSLGLIFCLLLLPCMKGVFMAIIWKTGAPTS